MCTFSYAHMSTFTAIADVLEKVKFPGMTSLHADVSLGKTLCPTVLLVSCRRSIGDVNALHVCM